MKISNLIPATLVARRAFYALGRKIVYTNNYKDCHTVKAYRTGSSNTDTKFGDSVVDLLQKNGYKNVTWHVTEADITGGIIIRIPK